MRCVLGGCLLAAACGEDPPPSTALPDARGPDTGVPRHLTVALALPAGGGRQLPSTLPPGESFTLTSPAQHGAIELANGVAVITYDGTPTPYVERLAAVAVHDPGLTVDFVFAVGGALFTGAVNGDVAHLPNWDGLTGPLADQPWVFVGENPEATLPLDTVHPHAVLIDGATVRGDALAIAGADFVNRGHLVGSTEAIRPRVTVRDGRAGGTVPYLYAEGAVGLIADVASERLIVQPGATATVAAGRILDTGIGESFVQAGGSLAIAGRFVNGRSVTVTGTATLTGAAARAELVRLEAVGTVAVDGGALTADTDLWIYPEGTVTIAAGASAHVAMGVYVDGTLVNHGHLVIDGTLELHAGATLVDDGTITAAACTSGGVANAPPCP